ncbi:MAG TPA: tRNA uridine(34) 5-carboxymethylaminomethyl modification radical SAM/GNAT enzyme Elp3, partial [Thermoplasmatales archaeon]|nr:tRNA uridine(34) 5-carboxymethylaminomethyl modification radical SAM/GNAT enzyme Elp3 [Thermoplasmatales archaeon]
MENVYDKIIKKILLGDIKTKQELHREKIKLCKEKGIKKIPPDSEIIKNLPDTLADGEKEILLSLLRKKPVRSLSGVTVVAVMTSP